MFSVDDQERGIALYAFYTAFVSSGLQHAYRNMDTFANAGDFVRAFWIVGGGVVGAFPRIDERYGFIEPHQALPSRKAMEFRMAIEIDGG